MGRVTPTVTQPTPAMDSFLTTKQAARLLKVSVDTLLELDIPWVPIGAGRKRPRRRYLQSSVFEWAKRRQAAA